MSRNVINLSLPRLFGNQLEIAKRVKASVFDTDLAERFFVLRCGRRFGKGVLAKHLLTEAMLAGMQVAWISPTYKMLAPVWREFRDDLRDVTKDKSEQEKHLSLITGGEIDFWSTESIESIRGRRYHLIADDECAMDPSLVEHWNAILRPTLADFRGRAIFPSTPRGRNGFYSFHTWALEPSQQEWVEFHRTTYDNPFIRKEEIDRLKITMSEKWFRQEIMAEFTEDSGTVFRNLENTLIAKSSMPDEHAGHLKVFGVDWGRDNDYTVVSIGCAECRREVFLDRYNKIDWEYQKSRTANTLVNWKVNLGTFELNSIGSPMFDGIIKLLPGIGCEGFSMTPKSKGPLIDMLALGLEKGDIQFLDDPIARAEMEAFEATRHESGYISFSAPEGMHDDTIVARALMYRKMCGLSTKPREIVRKNNPLEVLFGKRR